MTLAPAGPVNEISRVVRLAREAFDSGDTRSMTWRSRALSNLKDALLERQGEFVEAAAADFGRPGFEAWATEIGYTIAELNHVHARMARWSQPRRVPTPLILHPGSSRIVTEPRGLVCVISTWNYPVQLLLMPMIAAISAGNAVIGKPSEMSPHTNAVLGALFEDLDDPAIALVQGDSAAGSELLTHRFDHILYTGNRSVARAIMRAAAEFLTPVTLELGGKSPVIVSKHADIPLAARRIAWGKFFNAGQTCVAPDYVLVERGVHDGLMVELEKVIKEFYGNDPQQSPDLARIVNDHHFARLESLLSNGTVAVGGKSDPGSRYISPTVVTGVNRGDPLMMEEILGPILPVLPVDSLQDAIEFVRGRAKPLALYVFSRRKMEVRGIVGQVASGGVCINGTLVHVGNPHLPFGGIGESGIGHYHGKYGFDAFSQQRAVYTRGSWFDVAASYPPYTKYKSQLLRLGFVLPDPRNLAAALQGWTYFHHVRPRYRAARRRGSG